MGSGFQHAACALSVVLSLALQSSGARAQGHGAPAATPAEPPLALAAVASGRNIERIEVTFDEPLWAFPVSLSAVRVGQTFTPEVARRALHELGDSGRFGELRAEVQPMGAGVFLRLHVTARRVVQAVRLSGAPDGSEELLNAANVRTGGEVTARKLPELAASMQAHLASRGYPEARVHTRTFDTDDPMAVVLAFEVVPGRVARIRERQFHVWPDPLLPGLSSLLFGYKIQRGDRADSDAIELASRALEQRLQLAGFFDARVETSLSRAGDGARLDIRVYAGSKVAIRFEGHRSFDERDLQAALELATTTDRSPAALAETLRDFYVQRAFFDATVEARLSGTAGDAVRQLLLRVHEGSPVRVAAREYPCLESGRSAAEVGSEIDSFLSELPGGTLIDAVDPSTVDALYGPKHRTGTRATPYFLNPWSVYSPGVYERAVEHLQDLFRSEGYLLATVGPVRPLRRACDVRSPPGQCLPRGPRVRPPFACNVDPRRTQQDDVALDAASFCVQDLARGVRCEPEIVLSIPIKLGPQSHIDAVEMDGNAALPDDALRRVAALALGSPVSQGEIDRARRRLLDLYAEEGFAFVEIESELSPSTDHRRARVRFIISERKPVRVSRIVVRGARLTNESLIRGRLALQPGELYRRSSVRKTEERLATLGVFSSVTVGFEDPYVPASAKVVLVTLQERTAQYLDVRPGFSTGEGFRIGFEYGHRNLGGQAIQLTLRSQLGFLPLGLILEDDVRRKYEGLEVDERLERRNTATVEFPEVGLGPLFRASLEGVDVRDNARDFGLTKDAGIATLFYLPERRLSFQLAASLERNDARIFGDDQKCALDDFIQNNPEQANAFRVPEGPTLVTAQRVGANWDRRDNPLDATRGTLVAASVEHVSARPLGELRDPCARPGGEASVFEAVKSNFLRYTNRVAGYVRLSKRGLALAASFRWGYNQRLTATSRTYPDRLFFLGGVDSLRGFLQDSVVPEDVAQRLLAGAGLRIEQVVIRGGDVFVNPRLELRIPVSESVQTAVFLDAGNLWADPSQIDLLKLRYATGSGLRIGTPIGPLVFDYGFNLERVLDKLLATGSNQRYWEDLGAFHFGIGLF